MERIQMILILMGVLFLLVAVGLSVYWLVYSRSLFKTTGVITAEHWEKSGTVGSRCVVSVKLPDGSEKTCIARSVSSTFAENNYGKEVTCYARKGKVNGGWMEECIIEDGSVFSIPIVRFLIPVFAFLLVGFVLIRTGMSIH